MSAKPDQSRLSTTDRWHVISDPVAWLILYLLVATAVFLAFPAIDLWVTGFFYDPGRGFPLARVRFLRDLREINDLAVIGVLVGLAMVLAVKLARPERPSAVPPNAMLFLVTTLAVGPGLLVNVILKDMWGRPRPTMVDVFGGEMPYVEVWRLTDYCASNCSFVAGEASSAVWLMGLALVVPRGFRLPVALATGVLALALSVNRIAFGGHFLSDVMLAWGLTGLVVLLAHRFMVVRPPVWLAPGRLEDGLTRLGLKLRRGPVG